MNLLADKTNAETGKYWTLSNISSAMIAVKFIIILTTRPKSCFQLEFQLEIF